MNNIHQKTSLSAVLKLEVDKVTVSPEEFYPFSGVYSFGRGLIHREPVNGSQTSYPYFHRLHTDQIVLSQLKGWEGAIARVTPKFDGFFLSTQFPTFRVIDGNDVSYVELYLKQQSVWDELLLKARGIGARRSSISPDAFLSLTIPLPPLDEQRRIVAHIEALARRIEDARGLRRGAIEEAETLNKSELTTIYNSLINDYGYSTLNELIVDAGYGTSVKCDYERGEYSVPILRIPNVAFETINLNDLKFGVISDTELGRVTVYKGDILVVRTNGSAELVGRSAVIPDLPEMMGFASYLIRLRCDHNRVLPEYTQIILKHQRLTGRLFDLARTTAGQYNVSLGRLRIAEIPVPPMNIQRRIVAYLDELQEHINRLKKLQKETAAELDALLPSVLDKAFKGEL